MNLKNYPDGADITLINSFYQRPSKDQEGNRHKDFLTVVWRDNTTKQKYQEIIYEPEYSYYFYPNGYKENDAYNRFFEEESKLDKITVKYKDLKKDIAKRIGRLEEFYDNIRNSNSRANSFLMTDPRVYGADMDITAFHRIQFSRKFKNTGGNPTKAYLDIECDTEYIGGNFAEPMYAQVPVNAVSLLIEETMTEYTFILKDKRNKNSFDFIDEISSESFIQEFKNFLVDNLHGKKRLHKFKLDNINFHISFFDDELELIQSIFDVINYYKPDFVLAYNMAFDMPYLIKRIENLGADPKEVICHPDFKEKVLNYFVDNNHYNIYEDRGDYANISSYSVYLCQMILYASRRKGRKAVDSYHLDDVANREAGVRKLDYHQYSSTLSKLPYINFKVFIMYNMMDVIAQYCIEQATTDVNYVYNKALIQCTRYADIHKQTVYLSNRAHNFFYDLGYVMGNNCNKFKEAPTEKYAGAFVADPEFISPKILEHLDCFGGKYDRVIPRVANTVDYDYKRMYPSIAQQSNAAPNTQIGKIKISEPCKGEQNNSNIEMAAREGIFIENLTSQNYIEFASRWFNLGDYADVIDDIKEYFAKIENPSVRLENDFALDIVVRANLSPVKPVERVKDFKGIKHIVYYRNKNKRRD